MYVLGHKVPDTDAIIGAIAAAKLYNALGVECKPARLGELNKETQFLQKYFGFEVPELIESLPDGSDVILVDHNEVKQCLDNLAKLNIYAIIDHHKFSLQTDSPVNIRAEIIGSSASILYKMFKENNLEIDKQLAGMLVACILSDTLHFRSPTCTPQDKEIVEALNQIAGIADLQELSMQMFNAKSDLSEFSPEQIVQMDYKPFSFNGKNFTIGVMETTNPQFALDMQEALVEAQNRIKVRDHLDGILFFVVDILNENSKAIVCGDFERHTVLNAFNAMSESDNVVDVGAIVSRKKQIVPKLEAYFA
jgi:manganese-dependent inorganic pyrophosphatase